MVAAGLDLEGAAALRGEGDYAPVGAGDDGVANEGQRQGIVGAVLAGIRQCARRLHGRGGMAPVAPLAMDGIAHDEDRPRARMAAFLSRWYGKALSRELRCSEKVAKNLIAGHWPNDLVFDALVERFGMAFLEAIAGPTLKRSLAALDAEERRLLAQLDLVRSKKRDLSPLPAPETARGAWTAAERRVGADAR